MSIEITLFTKTATKSSLLKFITAVGFQKSRHFIDELNDKDNLHFMWFGFDNYESNTGVEATIYKLSEEKRKIYECSEWILHTRTRASGSYEDKRKQNDIIRNARKQFGGSFFNDCYGTNKYIDLSDYEKYFPLEKGISIVASNSLEKLEQIKDCLVSYRNEMSDTLANIQPETLRSLMINKDPSRVLYNSLMPFLVSIIEYFYGQIFENYLKYNEASRLLLTEEKIKIDLSDVLSILEKENSLEQIVTKSYNFQNLESINKAFKKYTTIDVKAILSQKKRINNNIVRILPKIESILEARHRFVHELDIDYNLTKEKYLDNIATVEKSIELITDKLRKDGLKIVIDY